MDHLCWLWRSETDVWYRRPIGNSLLCTPEIVHHFGKQGHLNCFRIYACTDLALDGAEALHMYQCRFQIPACPVGREFLFRDAKQHAGLTHCQARSKEKLHFHVNTALTAVSLAKAAYHLNKSPQDRGAFSMADISRRDGYPKTQYANELLLDRFIATFGNDLNMKKINILRRRLRNVGKIAA